MLGAPVSVEKGNGGGFVGGFCLADQVPKRSKKCMEELPPFKLSHGELSGVQDKEQSNMCWRMAASLHGHEEEMPQEHLRRKLAAAVRSVQWSYAIFWASSSKQQGALEWKEGHYNGDIKTRKTIQHVELNADEMGLERSEQLRELYALLSASDSNQQARRPSVSLSPEDLTDLEWYYLVCMSFTFNFGQGLPGKALASGHHIWLYNAHHADSKVFSRSLLAKSASIQTVVCFPLLSGILELGVTELISEKTHLIQCITSTFLEFPKALCDKGNHQDCDELKERVQNEENGNEDNLGLNEDLEQNDTQSSSSDDNSLMVNCMNVNFPVQSWQFMDDECSGDDSSDGMCQPLGNAESVPCGKTNHSVIRELPESDYAKLSPVDLQISDPHYSRTLEAIFGSYNEPTEKPSLLVRSSRSSFWTWKEGNHAIKPQCRSSQSMLKHVLSGTVIPSIWSKRSQDEIYGNRKDLKLDGINYANYHILSERKRREKINDKFSILKSLAPSVSKVDKVSILGDTIEYLKVLERRIEELEASIEQEGSEDKAKEHPDIVERTSDNYCRDGLSNGKQSVVNKRKACEMDGADEELNWVWSKDGLADLTVTIVDKEVVIEMKCPWRECLLMETVEAISTLHLDPNMVQSCTTDGILTLTLKSKFRGTAVASAGMIKHALQRVVGKY